MAAKDLFEDCNELLKRLENDTNNVMQRCIDVQKKIALMRCASDTFEKVSEFPQRMMVEIPSTASQPVQNDKK